VTVGGRAHARNLLGGRKEAGPVAADLVAAARAHERAGRLTDALAGYESAIALADRTGEGATQAEALRRASVVHHHLNHPDQSRALCQRSYEIALVLGDQVLAAEALNTLGGVEFERGQMQRARDLLGAALERAGTRLDLLSRIEQNLGILATIQGDHDAALSHYQHSLEACQKSGDEKGCAIAYHNLGMISADQRDWGQAESYYQEAYRIAERTGEVHLQGLCLLNHSEVHLARQAFEPARQSAEAALAVFDRLGSRMDKADAYRILGMIYRETGRSALAEARFRAAIDIAVATGAMLSEAEATREMARLHQGMGRNQEALTHLNRAWRLFRSLDAHLDLIDVQAKVEDLEGTYLAVVRDWGQSIESADSYTHGHCERVANYAVAVAEALGLSEGELTTIRLGAYLHDVGKVKVPHEILNKPDRLTAEEFAIIQQHPVWGLELLAAIEFPWDLKPIIRWHHEKYDGSGYPDGLGGDAIPLGAQIIGIVDVYDALTTTRSYRPAMKPEQALACLCEKPEWWRPDVFTAFLSVLGTTESVAA
jgi:putative nucleotidyltransferase with HDIG domain